MGSAFSGKRLLLVLIPLYIVVLSCIFLNNSLPFYWSQADPTYIHLFNGMNLASGSMEVGNTDNPGTTIQCFAAAVFFIKHLFSHSSVPLFEDVIVNSESYLYACSVILILLFVCVNYYTGVYIFRHTGNIGLSMLFQLIPLININITQRAILLEPESLIIIVAPFFMAYLFVKAPENKMYINKQLNNMTIIVFGMFSGFLIASKYTCVPVIILVLFILEKNKHRVLYMGTVIVSFFIFIIPALPKIKNMFQWVWNLATHDGIYGNGEERIINPSQFVKNLKNLFLTDTVFTSIYCIITIAFLIALVNRIGGKKIIRFFRTISGIWLSITALILVVAKHCDFHYFVFAECCLPFGLIISYKVFHDSFFQFIQGHEKYEKRILYSTFSLLIIFLIVEKVRYTPSIYTQPLSINTYLDEYKTIPLIIATKVGTQCERKEYALFMGNSHAGSLREKYTRFFKETYPDTYLCLYGQDVLIHWDKILSIPEFFATHKSTVIYLRAYDDTAGKFFIDKFCARNMNVKGEKCSEQNIYKDSKTLQSIYLIPHVGNQ